MLPCRSGTAAAATATATATAHAAWRAARCGRSSSGLPAALIHTVHRDTFLARSVPTVSVVGHRGRMSKFQHHSAFPKAKHVQGYRFPHVCLDCRKSFKFPVQTTARVCPQCKRPMVRLSRKFSAPQSSDLHQWRKVRYLVENGFLFYPIQEMIAPNASVRAEYPRTLSEAKLFVERYRSQAHKVALNADA